MRRSHAVSGQPKKGRCFSRGLFHLPAQSLDFTVILSHDVQVPYLLLNVADENGVLC